ncbi:MAG: cytochrome c [Anaerolineales bacterium]|nr:cytochrome c [Anaerolineales bacterium]
MSHLFIRLFGALILLGLMGCTQTPGSTRPTLPAPTIMSSPTTPLSTPVGDPSSGAQLWRDKKCAACHGPTAAGGMGGALANTALAFDQFLSKIRNALPPKPAMNANDLPDAQAYSIYLWLRTLGAQPAKATPASATLPTGQLLGIQVWVEKGCDQCHGAFAQGSPRAPALAGENLPFERQRAVMRQYADQNPAHGEKNISDDLLQRLLDWLKRGADPASGC